MPTDARGEYTGFIDEFLKVVLAEVEVGIWETRDGRSVKGDDIGDGFEFGDGDDAHGFGAVCFCGSGGDANVYLGHVGKEGRHSSGVRGRNNGGGPGDSW